LINFVDATNDANHYTKPPPRAGGMPQFEGGPQPYSKQGLQGH